MILNFLFNPPPLKTILSSDVCIAMTPDVAHILGERKVAYRIPEDFLKDKDLFSEEPAYFNEQLKWFESFDEFLKAHISLCRDHNIPLATSSFLRLKYFVDSLVTHGRVFSAIMSSVAPTEIRCWAAPARSFEPSIFRFHVYLMAVLAQLLESMGRERQIRFVKPQGMSDQPVLARGTARRASAPLFFDLAKAFFCFIKYKKLCVHSGLPSERTKENFLIQHAGAPEIDHFVEKLIHSPDKGVYVYEKGYLVDEKTPLRNRGWIDYGSEDDYGDLEAQCRLGANALTDNHPIVQWVSKQVGGNVNEIVGPFLRYFVEHECAQILRLAKAAGSKLAERAISFVLARGNTDVESLGILLGGKYLGGAKTLCVQHASSGLDGEAMSVYDTCTYDVVVARDIVSKQYLLAHSRPNKAYFCSSHYLKQISRKPYFGGGFFRRNSPAKTVLYVEKKFFGRLRAFNENMYALSEYFEFQKQIIDLFDKLSRLDGWHFVYKHAKGQEWAERSLLPYIREKRNSRLHVYEQHFLRALNLADRVIVDYPSGSMFEAAAARKSLLCIVPSYFRLSDGADHVFKKVIRPFETFLQATRSIEEFLKADPSSFRISFPLLTDEVEIQSLFGFDQAVSC